MRGEVAVVVDGAGVPARFRSGCEHSVAWFAHALCEALLETAQEASTLREALAAGIAQVRDLHAGHCELDRGGPSATVAMARRCGAMIDHLVLCDCSLLLRHTDGSMRRLTDLRVDQVRRRCRASEQIEAQRNRPGGFWVARHEPEAAHEALCGTLPVASLERLHLVTDGVTRAVDLCGLMDDDALDVALARDPAEMLRRLREAEAALDPARRPRKVHDDATVITLRPGEPSC